MTDEDPADAIAFGTDGWRATLSTFTDERVRWVAQGVASTLAARGHDDETVAVGYDARESSRGFAESIARVLAANGFDVLLPDRDVPTPVTAWTVAEREFAAGVVVTASHNPPEYNGVKFVTGDGEPAPAGLTADVEAHLAAPQVADADVWGTIREADLVEPYLDHALAFVADLIATNDADLEDHSTATLEGRTVAYDAMHGSGRGVTDALLQRAGADVERLRAERDPEFGGTPPEPVADRVPELVERVTDPDSPVDLGVVNDGDADRIGVVTPARGYLDPNLFFAAIYDYCLASKAGDVVRTVSTSSIVDRVAAAHDQRVHETAVGFKWVAEAMAEHDALVGGEESGGFGLRGHVRNKDGVVLALLAAVADAQESLDERVDRLLATHGEIHQGRVSVDCPDDRKEAVLAALEAHIPQSVAGSEVADVATVDGFKLALADGGWLLVRPSGTEPKLRVYAEGDSEGRVGDLLAAGRDLVEPLV